MRCVLAAFLGFLLSGPCLAQEPSPGPDTESSPASAETQPPLSEQLRSLATMLEQATTDSASDWDQWYLAWTSHLKRLEGLVALSTELEHEKKSMKASLDNYERSLLDSISREAAARGREALWRVIGLTGMVVGLSGILFAIVAR